MRAAVASIAIAGLLVLSAGGTSRADVSQCPTSAGMKDASKKTRPSSFAPRPKPPNNAYGQPIGGKILTRHTKKKPPLT